MTDHRPDCPVTHWPDKPERCRCIFMAAIEEMRGGQTHG